MIEAHYISKKYKEKQKPKNQNQKAYFRVKMYFLETLTIVLSFLVTFRADWATWTSLSRNSFCVGFHLVKDFIPQQHQRLFFTAKSSG
jgi:hypothetical protein